jgi:hypothetical protein
MVTPLTLNKSFPLKNSSLSQVVQQEVLTRLLVEKGIFTKKEFLEMVKVVDREIKRKRAE